MSNRKERPAHYNLTGCADFYDLADQNLIPPAPLEAITKLARAWVRESRGEADPVLSDLYAARVAINRQIQIEERRAALDGLMLAEILPSEPTHAAEPPKPAKPEPPKAEDDAEAEAAGRYHRLVRCLKGVWIREIREDGNGCRGLFTRPGSTKSVMVGADTLEELILKAYAEVRK